MMAENSPGSMKDMNPSLMKHAKSWVRRIKLILTKKFLVN